MKKIDVYVNGVYQYSTTRHSTVKAAIAALKMAETVEIASVPRNKTLTIAPTDRITGRIAKAVRV